MFSFLGGTSPMQVPFAGLAGLLRAAFVAALVQAKPSDLGRFVSAAIFAVLPFWARDLIPMMLTSWPAVGSRLAARGIPAPVLGRLQTQAANLRSKGIKS